ncbi:MAG TPA: CoA transferase, partial [Streptosporangiaceae bacterium]|nr:CoA transferase [Streptosporangiaceae bacterium]
MASDGVLGGIKVVDLSEQVPGPYATRLLAGLGADVIKVERPDAGDRLRQRPVMFAAENRGKRDLSVDLKSADGRAALLRLIATADVLVEAYRPGVMDRLGLGFDALLEVNPQIIYLS